MKYQIWFGPSGRVHGRLKDVVKYLREVQVQYA